MMNFYVVDAFANKFFSGNPAAVFFVDDFLDTIEMQKVASEFNLSATAFVKFISSNHFAIRWFSPKDEIPICGHATLAAAHLLFSLNKVSGNQITFESLAGQITAVSRSSGEITLVFPQKQLQPAAIPELLMRALGYVPIESVYRDDQIYVIVLSRPEDLLRIDPNLNKIMQLPSRAVTLTAVNNGIVDEKVDFMMRYFAPKVGIPEDPVCGSAHIRLFPFWGERLQKTNLTSYSASKRGGIIKGTYDVEKVYITAKSQTVISGEFYPIP